MKIAVLAGGLSPERDVSLLSGSLIANALAKSGHLVALMDIYFDQDAPGAAASRFKSGPFPEPEIPDIEPKLEAVAALRVKIRGSEADKEELLGRGVIEICREADIAFLALHGDMGENGQLQAMLDCHGIRYTGSGYEGCVLAMNKEISKIIVRDAGMKTADWMRVDGSMEKGGIIGKIGLPCVIKPVSCGSSVGVSLVRTDEELSSAIELAERSHQTVIAEEFIKGREFSVGVLCDRALPSIEIISDSGFYDYANKYQSSRTTEITPARVSSETEKRLGELALKAHKALRLGSYSRTDFIIDEQTGEIVFLETNTLPGMTPVSLLPKEAAAVGISYSELCGIIVKNPV